MNILFIFLEHINIIAMYIYIISQQQYHQQPQHNNTNNNTNNNMSTITKQEYDIQMANKDAIIGSLKQQLKKLESDNYKKDKDINKLITKYKDLAINDFKKSNI